MSVVVVMASQNASLLDQKKARSKRRRNRHLKIKSKVDTEQDALLEELQLENDQLQLCLGGLIQILIDKEILSREELEGIATLASDSDDPNEG
jgi:hypothetical protein